MFLLGCTRQLQPISLGRSCTGRSPVCSVLSQLQWFDLVQTVHPETENQHSADQSTNTTSQPQWLCLHLPPFSWPVGREFGDLVPSSKHRPSKGAPPAGSTPTGFPCQVFNVLSPKVERKQAASNRGDGSAVNPLFQIKNGFLVYIPWLGGVTSGQHVLLFHVISPVLPFLRLIN